jgi:hypothetical protein
MSNVVMWEPKQLALIQRTVAKDCNPAEFDLFIHTCKQVHLDPLRKQIYAFVMHKGRAIDNPATDSTIYITGGTHTFVAPWMAYNNVGANSGLVYQTGGHVTFLGGTYKRATAAAATDPWLYQTGGTASVHPSTPSPDADQLAGGEEIGRASCRERV